MKFQFAIVAVLATLLGGCNFMQDATLTACEDALKDRLRSPSTYQRVEVSSYPKYGMTEEKWLEEFAKLPSDTVKRHAERAEWATQQNQTLDLASHFVSYDAANAYGTPVRGLAHCTFPMVDKKSHEATKENVLIDGLDRLTWLLSQLER